MAVSTKIPFVELCAKTNYSFLEATSHPQEVIRQAKALGYDGIGIADRNGVYGLPRAHIAAKEENLPLICGAEISLNGNTPVTLLAKNRTGYGDLCELLTLIHCEERDPTLKDLLSREENLFLLLPVEPTSAEALGPYLKELKEIFSDQFYLVSQRFFDGHDLTRLQLLEWCLRKYQLRAIASNIPLFHVPERKLLHDVVRCIQHGCSLNSAGNKLLPNAERYLKSKDAFYKLFSDHPDWLENTQIIAEQCHFSLDELRYHYPNEWIPKGETTDSYLKHLVWEGVKKRYGEQLPTKAREQIEKELVFIRDLKYADYFLTTWDVVRFARSEGILCQGRGSAANSIVCYLLGITSIDPIRLDLLFERFLSRERKEPPDIDIDFEHERREEVIQYIYKRYGRHRAAISAEVICYRKRSALREVAKVFEIPVELVEKFIKLSHRRHMADLSDEKFMELAPFIPTKTMKLYLALVQQIKGFPRHIGTHVGGFVLTHDKLTRSIPVENAAMPNRTIVQWDKYDLDVLGFVRVDVLGLGMLTTLSKTMEAIKTTYKKEYTLATIPAERSEVYDSICKADTVGVFQIESRAQMSMLPRLKPRTFFDLVVEISIVRPGPIQGDMVHPYLRRREKKESIEYPIPELKRILEKTYGVPIFQEQVMAMAMAVADFTAGEADNLRRAMGTWRKEGGEKLARIAAEMEQRLIGKGVREDFAKRIVNQIQGFAEYGFPESHAASFAILAYASAYLRLKYPDAFLTGILNSQPMGFYSPHTLIHDAQRHGTTVLDVDVFYSDWDCLVEKPGCVRLGFREIKGFPKKTGLAIEELRNNNPSLFKEKESNPKNTLLLLDFVDALKKTLHPIPLTKRELFCLAFANAFRSLGLERREAIWEVQALFLDTFPIPHSEEPTLLPKETPWEKISFDYESRGVSLYSHPMRFFRGMLRKEGYLDSKEIQKARRKKVKVSGVVICRQMPGTAGGVLFITLEDEFGFFNLVVWRNIYEKYREIILSHSFLKVSATLESPKEAKVLHLIVDSIEPLFTCEEHLQALPSHDFH